MKTFIVETIGMHRQVHLVEAADEATAMEIARVADDNWQEYLGEVKIDISEHTPERVKHFEEKEYFWAGISFRDENGKLSYRHPNGAVT